MLAHVSGAGVGGFLSFKVDFLPVVLFIIKQAMIGFLFHPAWLV
jgi:hypothetical protein